MSSLLENTIRGLTNKDDAEKPFVPIFGQQLVEGYEKHWQEMHRRTTVLAKYARYTSQQMLPLHDCWQTQSDDYRAFQKEASTLSTELFPALTTLNKSIHDLTNHMQALEDVLVILLEQKEEETRQEFTNKKDKELVDQKQRFLNTYKETENRFVSEDFKQQRKEAEVSLRDREREMKKKLEEDLAREKEAVNAQLAKAEEEKKAKAAEQLAAALPVAVTVSTPATVPPPAATESTTAASSAAATDATTTATEAVAPAAAAAVPDASAASAASEQSTPPVAAAATEKPAEKEKEKPAAGSKPNAKKAAGGSAVKPKAGKK